MGANTPNDHIFPRKLSFSLVLSDNSEYDGGTFEVMYSKKPEQLQQKKGRLLVFPSYMLHRVNPVTRGTRKSLVFWVVGPKFR
jgi:PKHD-type hydroxylase